MNIFPLSHNSKILAALLCIGLMVVSTPAMQPQEPASQAQDPQAAVIRVQTNMVTTRFHVLKDGYYVDTIRKEDISIFQDGKAQVVEFFEGPGSEENRIPVEIILLLDVSMSVVNPGLINGILLKSSVLDALGSYVSISIYGFAKRLKRFCQLTREVPVLERALSAAYAFAGGGTLLYESIVATCAAADQKNLRARRVLVVFSDGFDTKVKEGGQEMALEAARASDIKLFPVVLGHLRQLAAGPGQGARGRSRSIEDTKRVVTNRGPASQGRAEFGNLPSPGVGSSAASTRQLEREFRMEKFADLGEKTGGRSFDPRELNQQVIENILKIVVDSVRSEYMAGYYVPAGPQPGKHKVQVRLASRSLGKVRGGEKEFIQ